MERDDPVPEGRRPESADLDVTGDERTRDNHLPVPTPRERLADDDDDNWPPPLLARRETPRGAFAGLIPGNISERALYALIGWFFALVVLIVVIDPIGLVQSLSQTPATGEASPGLARLGIVVLILVFATIALLGARVILRLRDPD